MGWRLEGDYPGHLLKKIIIVAPHTSMLDFPIGIMVKFWLDIRVTFYAKEELFNGLVGWILRSLGGRPVDRSKNKNMVAQAVADFNANETYGMLITPEGTRKKVAKFKSGFYYIALNANVPLVPVAFDFERKVIKIFDTWIVRGEGLPEIEAIRQLYVGIKGRVPEYSIT